MKATIAFNRKVCNAIGKAAEKALKDVAKEYGISIKRTSGSFTLTNYTMKFEAAIVGKDGVIHTKAVEDFKFHCGRYGLAASDLGKTFVSDIDLEIYKITGLTSRASKFPILAENTRTKKVYKFPERIVQRALGKKVTANLKSLPRFGELDEDNE